MFSRASVYLMRRLLKNISVKPLVKPQLPENHASSVIREVDIACLDRISGRVDIEELSFVSLSIRPCSWENLDVKSVPVYRDYLQKSF